MNQFLRAFFVCLLAPLYAVAQNNYAQIAYIASSVNSSANLSRIDDAGNLYLVVNSANDVEVKGMSLKKRGTNFSTITKIAANGNLVWARTLLVNTGADRITDLQVDKDQNVYLAGYGNNVMPDGLTTLSPGPFLIKLNKNSETLWSIGPNDGQAQVTTPGLIALTNNGVYWSAGFVKRLVIQSRDITATDPAGGTADAFIANVSASGQINAVYHHPIQAAEVQLLQPTKSGQVAAVIRLGNNNVKLILDPLCNVVSQKSFFNYGDQIPLIQATATGYQAFSYSYDDPGYMDTELDDELNKTSAYKVFPLSTSPTDVVTGGIGFDPSTAFYTRNFQNTQQWIVNESGTVTTLPAEQSEAFTRSFIKVVDDTVHMLIRHRDLSTTTYSFYGKNYTDKIASTNAYFWVKYRYKTSDPCLKLIASVTQNGIEGTQDATIKVSLPDNCVAAEDLTINLKESNPANNKNDLVLPANFILKKGQNSAEVNIKITDDTDIEPEESFDIELTLATNASAYKIASGTTFTFTIADNDNTAANRIYSVTYQPEMAEGGNGNITVSLLPGIKLSEPLTFAFDPDNSTYSATSGADFSPINIVLPAGSNTVNYKVNALTDKMIEGDEFISGKISSKASAYGAFTSANNNIKIKITDADNTAENRIIDISPAGSILAEGGNNTYLFKPAAGYTLQYPLNITTQQLIWQPFLQQTVSSVQLSEALKTSALSINYPDDNVIRSDNTIKLGLTATDTHTGTFRFRWNGQIIEVLNISATDNDMASAKVLLSPRTLSIVEGKTSDLNLKVADNKVFENEVTIRYAWAGNDVNADDRIVNKGTTSLTLPKEQNKLSIPDRKSVV